jgi:membrane protease YdiL (CAAX protease family)
MNLIVHILALIVGLALPIFAAVMARRAKHERLTTEEKLRIYWGNSVNIWFLTAVVAGAWTFGERGLDDLGVRSPIWSPAATWLVVAFTAWMALDVQLQLRNAAQRERLRARWRADTPFMPETRKELLHFALMTISAGICEELLFRGFLIRYLEELLGTGSIARAAAVGLPALVFGLAHSYQGAARAAKIVVLAVAFGVLLVLTSSILVPMALHAALDLPMGALGVAPMGGDTEKPRNDA